MKKIIIPVILLLFWQYTDLQGQANNKQDATLNNIYPGGSFYKVEGVWQVRSCRKPKNVILMIGDGMGVAQVFAGVTANGGHLWLDNFRKAGFSKTQPAKRYVTDSAAGATAIATGQKTNNGAIGVDTAKQPVENIFEIVRKKRISTGLVVTSDVTDATPASFVAHVPSRYQNEEIANGFVKSGINLFIGEGRNRFEERKDGRNLLNELSAKGYKVCKTVEEIKSVGFGNLAGLLEALPPEKRGDQLAVTTEAAMNLLNLNPEGFFLLVEGSEIDGGGHNNNMSREVGEMLDFDRAVGKALKFAEKDRRTLVVVTADHETGGLSLTDGDMSTGMVTGSFSSGNHTGIMVPVFAYGPGSDEFTGIFENTGLFERFVKVLKLKR